MEELGLASKARLMELEQAPARLQVAGLPMLRALWPGAVQPESMSRLSRWLEAGSARLGNWRASAARDGVYMALWVAKSWYSDLDLGLLAA
ncbi:hypothetical protein D1007_60733 [Hordeum vulgare]|nr:hypothetical protein D1007_60733 [Hordeum vulgare]